MPVDISQFAGKTLIITSRNQMALTANERGNEDGAPVVLLPPGEGQGQQWQLVDAGNGQCSIRSTSNGKVLDVREANQGPFAPVVQWPPNGTPNQLWTLEDVGNGAYYISSITSPNVLGLSLLKIFPPFVAQVPKEMGEQWFLQEVG